MTLSWFLTRTERFTRIPAKYLVPVALAGIALQVAVVGMYWDVGYHVDHGRDQGVLTLPHGLIVLGLQGIVIAALLHAALPAGPAARASAWSRGSAGASRPAAS